MATGNLSEKNIPPRDRLILALDVPSLDEGKRWVERLGDSVTFYKLGLQFLMTGQYFDMVDWLNDRGKKVFADIKFFDVPETVKLAVEQLARRRVDFATVHGNDPMLEAAASAKGAVKILAVTVLTSLDRGDLDDLGFQCDPADLVLSRARRALRLGCDGVISSGLEASRLRAELGAGFLVVSPGIRPVENRPADDQKRTMDVEDAFRAGADYIVVGRPIRKAEDPRAKAEEIQERIARLFA
ncbi:MAG TPA: orotidine-5'-phosphate decarboxylase [Opitutaceae bacterium]|jgi:orotidine-5'-phosphate decarboxylase